MLHFLVTKWRGRRFYAERKARAVELLREALERHPELGEFGPGQTYAPPGEVSHFASDFEQVGGPMAIVIDDGAWKPPHIRRIASNYCAWVGRQGGYPVRVTAEDVLADVEGVVARLGDDDHQSPAPSC